MLSGDPGAGGHAGTGRGPTQLPSGFSFQLGLIGSALDFSISLPGPPRSCSAPPAISSPCQRKRAPCCSVQETSHRTP